MITISVLLAIGLLTMSTSLVYAKHFDVVGPKDQAPQSTDTGKALTQHDFNHPKSIHIPGQNKCQTLDGFSASEPCDGGGSGHHGKHHTKHSSDSTSGGTTTNTFSSSPPSELIQLPSNRSDFSNGDTNSIHLVYVHGTVDPDGFWHVDGMVQNAGNKTIQMLTVMATIYNATRVPISNMQQPAIIGSNTLVEPGQEKPFQLYNNGIAGQTPVFFKLGYNW